MEASVQNISRRGFLSIAALGAALTAGAVASGCAAASREDGSEPAVEIAETLTADIVVVGGGMSGLAAAVQAGLNGDDTVFLEATGTMGGSAQFGLSGLFGLDSAKAKARGITFDIDAVIQHEQESAQFANDPLLWRKEIGASGAQIDWLEEQGVLFEDVIDNYHETSIVPCMHWFKDMAAVGYVPPMLQKVEETGVRLMMETTATQLVMENGAVAGVYAERKDGSVIEIQAPAVILATGGFSANVDMMASYGFNPDRLLPFIPERHQGDGKRMAMEVGGGEFMSPCWEGILALEGSFDIEPVGDSPIVWLFAVQGPGLWVNQDAKRFVREDVGFPNFDLPVLPVLAQRETYAVFTRNMAARLLEEVGSDVSALDGYIEHAPDSIFEAETIYDLASLVGLDETAFKETVDAYRAACESGVDELYGKAPEFLEAMEEGPFYIANIVSAIDVSVGAVNTDHDSRVLDTEYSPIDGLYAIGLDGCMLYRNVYTIQVSGTACMNSVFTGRTAANHAHAYVAKA